MFHQSRHGADTAQAHGIEGRGPGLLQDLRCRGAISRGAEDDGLGAFLFKAAGELAELRRVCDRIAIIDKGRVVGILAPDAPDVEFGLLMGGGIVAGEGRR